MMPSRFFHGRRWFRQAVALGLAASWIGVASGTECPPSPTYSGPAETFVAQSGDHGASYGLTSLNEAKSWLDYLAAGDDCERMIVWTEYANEEFSWTLQAPAGCLYTVTYYFDALASGHAITDVDNIFDCDYAEAEAHTVISPGMVSATATAESSDLEDSDTYNETITSTQSLKSCVGNGTKFCCQLLADTMSSIISEALADPEAAYSTPGFWRQDTPCQ